MIEICCKRKCPISLGPHHPADLICKICAHEINQAFAGGRNVEEEFLGVARLLGFVDIIFEKAAASLNFDPGLILQKAFLINDRVGINFI